MDIDFPKGHPFDFKRLTAAFNTLLSEHVSQGFENSRTQHRRWIDGEATIATVALYINKDGSITVTVPWGEIESELVQTIMSWRNGG